MVLLIEREQAPVKGKKRSVIFCSMLLIWVVAGVAFAADKKEHTAYEEALLSYINQYRMQQGLHQLSFDRLLNELAKTHSQQMHSVYTLDHNNFDDRFKQCGRKLCVENVGWNFMTPQDQFQAWKKSVRHNENMLNKWINHAGISRIGSYVTFFACD